MRNELKTKKNYYVLKKRREKKIFIKKVERSEKRSAVDVIDRRLRKVVEREGQNIEAFISYKY